MFWKLQENILEGGDIEVLVNFIRSTARFTQFEKVREFERAWSAWQGSKYSVFVNSGSSANLLMMSAMKEKYGWDDKDEIIVPAVTWITNITPVLQCGLTPVFVDVNLTDLSFDYEKIERVITPKTRAIFITHLLGVPADMKRLRKLAEARDIKLMEDCCEAHGATVDGVKVGSLSSCGSFSFYWGHHMTTVEGGMICTDDEDIYRLCVLKRSHGLARELPESYHSAHKEKHPDIDFQFLFLTEGYNVRNTELHAVLGIEQLKHLDRYIRIRNENHRKFLEILAPYKEFLHFSTFREGTSSFSLPFLFHKKEHKEAFQAKIRKAGIESRPVISGNLMRQPFLKKFAHPSQFPNAEFVHEHGFYIGNNQFVGEDRLQKLQELVAEFFTEISVSLLHATK
ncbi:MAG: DegT/DnrJ/EryC1/StrS aminotransferase family protein [Candidatus Liptonbacteria bacterium]|nr:DegT/DnrJ/EryC1/StrS aminotransferase family protein [Candidatus Liptonbacteria bacterium]